VSPLPRGKSGDSAIKGNSDSAKVSAFTGEKLRILTERIFFMVKNKIRKYLYKNIFADNKK
jgi:hypothetical protein